MGTICIVGKVMYYNCFFFIFQNNFTSTNIPVIHVNTERFLCSTTNVIIMFYVVDLSPTTSHHTSDTKTVPSTISILNAIS